MVEEETMPEAGDVADEQAKPEGQPDETEEVAPSSDDSPEDAE